MEELVKANGICYQSLAAELHKEMIQILSKDRKKLLPEGNICLLHEEAT